MIGSIIRKATEYAMTGRERPQWLEKQIAGCLLMEDDQERGLALWIDGLQDELDNLDDNA